MGSQENCQATGGEPGEQVLQRARGDRINTLKRFVEKKNFRAMNQGTGQRKFLLHPMRVFNNQLARLVAEFHEIEKLRRAPGNLCFLQAIHSSRESKHLGASQSLKKIQIFGNDPNPSFHFQGFDGKIAAEHPNPPTRGSKQACKHLYGGGFAGAVGAEKAKEASAPDNQVEVVNGYKILKASHEIESLNGPGGRR